MMLLLDQNNERIQPPSTAMHLAVINSNGRPSLHERQFDGLLKPQSDIPLNGTSVESIHSQQICPGIDILICRYDARKGLQYRKKNLALISVKRNARCDEGMLGFEFKLHLAGRFVARHPEGL